VRGIAVDSVQHVSVASRDVAVWKPLGTPPPNGYPLIVFSHGFTGCNTQNEIPDAGFS
jgi:hypothetical protein